MEATIKPETKSEAFFISMTLSAWNAVNERVTKLLNELAEEQWMTETAPGRSRGIYLLGHLVAVSDRLITLFGLGERLYPQLDHPFLTSPDKTVQEIPTFTELKKYWTTINDTLTTKFNTMTPEDWFARHTAVSEEVFAKEPHRNKLNVLINRTNHTNYHLGQLIYLKQK
ncbi:DinB family protein [Chryseosolibacter indicus]|uniref:DinB family protein n=1 Tax=Chryseosolibacter indicus TaxID=2782351 RepID=A0ABS5VY36_9BACT|nr:DinB family protein [Chryseosolibacter indicus]MBT1705839.1 DinB family protein [Chryseosolibacter indicus]